jgi:hypothetical protein
MQKPKTVIVKDEAIGAVLGLAGGI